MLSASLPWRLTVSPLTLFQPLYLYHHLLFQHLGREGRNENNIFLATLPLFFQTESTETTKLLLPLRTLFIMGDFAVDREVERCCKPMRRNSTGRKKVPPDELCLSFPALPTFTIIERRKGRKSVGMMTMNWRKGTEEPLSAFPVLPHIDPLIHTGLRVVLHSLLLPESSSTSHSVFKVSTEQASSFSCRERTTYQQLCEKGW